MRAKGDGFFAAAETLPYETARLVAGQLKDDSCVAACLLMILRDQNHENIYEAELRAALDIRGEGALLSAAPGVLSAFGYAAAYRYCEDLTWEDLQQAVAGGAALVALRRGERGSHALLVDGIEADAYVLIRDPLPELFGSSYKVAVETFLRAWIGKQPGRGRGVIVE